MGTLNLKNKKLYTIFTTKYGQKKYIRYFMVDNQEFTIRLVDDIESASYFTNLDNAKTTAIELKNKYNFEVVFIEDKITKRVIKIKDSIHVD